MRLERNGGVVKEANVKELLNIPPQVTVTCPLNCIFLYLGNGCPSVKKPFKSSLDSLTVRRV